MCKPPNHPHPSPTSEDLYDALLLRNALGRESSTLKSSTEMEECLYARDGRRGMLVWSWILILSAIWNPRMGLVKNNYHDRLQIHGEVISVTSEKLWWLLSDHRALRNGKDGQVTRVLVEPHSRKHSRFNQQEVYPEKTLRCHSPTAVLSRCTRICKGRGGDIFFKK